MRLSAAAGCLLALTFSAPSFAAGPKSGGIYTVADDLVGGSAGSSALAPAVGGCSARCLSGSLGQVATSSMTGGAASSGSGYFDFHYSFERLVVLLPGENLAPGTASGKQNNPSNHLTGAVFPVFVYGTDRAWNVASTAAANVTLSTTGFVPTPGTLAMVNGRAVFGSVTFTSSGPARTILAEDLALSLSTRSSAVGIFDLTSASPTVSIDFANGSIQQSLNGGVSGLAGDGNGGVTQVRAALRDLMLYRYYDWPAGGWAAPNGAPIFSNATLSNPNGVVTHWTVSLPDAQLTDGTSYYAVAFASNASGNFSVAETTFSFAPNAGAAGAAGDGEGTALASVSFSSVGCRVQVATITFVVGPSGMQNGGLIALHLPNNWQRPIGQDANPSPANPGFFSVISPVGFGVKANPASVSGATLGDNWIVYTASAALSSGQSVTFIYKGFPGFGPAAIGTQLIGVGSQGGPSGHLTPIQLLPSFPLFPGAARTISFEPQQPLTVGPLQTSPTMQIVVGDGCGNSTNTASNLVLDVLAGEFGAPDATAVFYAAGGAPLPAGSQALRSRLTIPAGSNSTPGFYYVTNPSGITSETLIATATFGGAPPAFAGRFVNILGSSVSISGVSIDTRTIVPGALVATMTVTANNGAAVINFTLSNPQLHWEVIISTSPNDFYPEVVHRFGVGNPGRSLSWNGINERVWPQRFEPPGGPYYVKIKVEGGVVEDQRLRVYIGPSASIYGSVKSTGAYAFVQAQGAGASFGNFAVASSTGYFAIFGLNPGRGYNIVATTGTVAQGQFLRLTSSSNNVVAQAGGTNVGDIPFPTPSLLRVRVQIPNAAPHEFWGGLNVHTQNYSNSSFGTLHYGASADKSDDGGQSFGSNASTWTVLGLLPGTYDLDINLQQVGISSTITGVVVGAGATTDVEVTLARKANVLGFVVLPSTTPFGTWVSVQGTKKGDRRPTIFGGAFVQGDQGSFAAAQTTAPFSLFGLDPSTWTITARAFGFASVSSTVVVSTSDVGGLSFGQGYNLALSSGGSISGVLNLRGNSTLLPALNNSQRGLDLFINVYNPNSFTSAGVQVHLSTSATLASSTFTISGLDDGTYFVNAFINGATPIQRSVPVVSGAGTATLDSSVNDAKVFLTVKLPTPLPGSGVLASELKKVALYQDGSGGPVLRQDLVGGNTVQYFVSSATWQSGSLGAGYFTFTALYGQTGMFKTVNVPLANDATAFAVLDLSGSTFSVTGNVVLSAGINFSAGNQVIAISSIPGILANSAAADYCLMGSPAGVSTRTFHLELLPVSPFGGRFLNDELPRVNGSCASPQMPDNRGGGGNGPPPNPFLAFIGSISTTGAFAFNNVPPGTYLLRVPTDVDGNSATEELPAVRQIVQISSDASGLTFRLDKGVTVSGQLNLPPGVTASRSFFLSLLDSSGSPLKSMGVNFNNSNSAPYSFDRVPDGGFALRVDDVDFPRVYGAKPRSLKVAGVDVLEQNLQLIQTGIIKGKMAVQQSLAGSTTRQFLLIGQNNLNLLPRSLSVRAEANPWFEGGYAQAQGNCGSGGGNCGGLGLDENDQFLITGVLPGVYDVRFESFNDPNDNSSINLVRFSAPGVLVSEGRTTDIGTVNLAASQQLRGAVYDAVTSTPLANISIRARPAVSQNREHDEPRATSDRNGNFTLVGLDPAIKLYDIYVADRGEGQGAELPPYELKIAPSVDVTSISALTFNLNPAPYSLSGRVLPQVGGPSLRQPFGSHGSDSNSPGAVVFVQKTTELPRDNPIGDIVVPTDADGFFNIGSLAAGTYKILVGSLDYNSLTRTVTITTASVNVGSLSLSRGGTLSGNIRKPDGSAPSEREIEFLIAATSDLSELLFGSLVKDANNRTITSYSVSGFRPGVSYRLIIGDKGDAFSTPDEARSIVFSSSTELRTLDFVLRPSRPFAFAKARKVGSAFQVALELSQPLRAKTVSDDAVSVLLSTFSGRGALSEIELSANRSILTALYTPGVGDSSFTLRLNAFSTVTDPDSVDPINPEFVYLSTFTFFTGVDGLLTSNVSNVNGGTLLVEGNNGRISIPSGAFSVDASSSVEVTLQISAETLSGAAASGLKGAAANVSALRYGGNAYPSSMLSAMAATPPSVSPFSGFYDVLLPLGVRTALQKPVQMTVSYSTSTDPATLNLYWYNAAANAYILQQDVTGASRVIDTVNHTITINVNHFSTFVLFNTGVAVITGNTFAGSEIEAFNFPNPFDLSVKTVTSIHPAASNTIRGTMIRFALPPDVSGDGSIRVFNVVGERVRTIDLGTLAGGNYFYQAWDGRNDSGRDVASGVYIGQVKVGGKSKFFKMALIK